MAVKMTPHAISVSEHTRAKLVGSGLSEDKITVIPNGLSLSSIKNAPPLVDGPDILFAGRLIREKRVHLLLQAMSKAPLSETTAKCWVVGKGSDAEYLKRMAADLELGDRVKFFDWLSEEELYGAMSSAAAFTLLSEREGFGMVVLEAMAGGTPVVVARGINSAAPDLVEDGVDGFVTDPDPEQISRSLANLVNDRALSTRMGQAGRQKASGFGWDRITDQTESLYMKLAGLPPIQEKTTAELDEAA